MVLLIDNYDSFVHNLARYFRELGEETVVARNDRITLDGVAELRPSHIVISPGPCTPQEAGISNSVVLELGGRTPILGVCLGHQCIGAAFGGAVVRAERAVHGKASAIHHSGSGIFAGIPSPFRAARYHSLGLPQDTIPAALEVVAVTEWDEVMAVRHRSAPIWGVQFHPESVLTEHGHALLRNFLRLRPTGAARTAADSAEAAEDVPPIA
jgi:anthranilate synthase/aminodeoxychorismate synthase-like glutamine amidotransferase